MLLLIPKRLFLVVLPDFHTAYLTANGLGKFVNELYDTGVFVRERSLSLRGSATP